MKRKIKLGRLEDLMGKELKDPKFLKAYEQDRRSLFLAYRILELRERLRLTQKQLASRMETSQQAVARLESGQYEGFTIKTLEKVADALGAELVIDIRKRPRKSAV
jgi:ribosome-binding protein aMBF1 (putative translation factor)